MRFLVGILLSIITFTALAQSPGVVSRSVEQSSAGLAELEAKKQSSLKLMNKGIDPKDIPQFGYTQSAFVNIQHHTVARIDTYEEKSSDNITTTCTLFTSTEGFTVVMERFREQPGAGKTFESMDLSSRNFGLYYVSYFQGTSMNGSFRFALRPMSRTFGLIYDPNKTSRPNLWSLDPGELCLSKLKFSTSLTDRYRNLLADAIAKTEAQQNKK